MSRILCTLCKTHHRVNVDCSIYNTPWIPTQDNIDSLAYNTSNSTGFHLWDGDRKSDLRGNFVHGYQAYLSEDVEMITDCTQYGDYPLWNYNGLPEYDNNHWYSYQDIAQVMAKTVRQAQTWATYYNWRYRSNLRAQNGAKEFWIYDLIATIWGTYYMKTLEANLGYESVLDSELIQQSMLRVSDIDVKHTRVHNKSNWVDTWDYTGIPYEVRDDIDFMDPYEIATLAECTQSKVKQAARSQHWRKRVDRVYNKVEYLKSDVIHWLKVEVDWIN